MIIQSLSIAVPAGCPNRCKFCVSQMHEETYINKFGKEKIDLRFEKDYKNRLAFARDNGVNSLMFTGNGEAIMNPSFVNMVADLNRSLSKPFRNLEFQTSGVLLTSERLQWLRRDVNISTISLSLSCIWDSTKNAEYCGTPDPLAFSIPGLCSKIKEEGLNLRLSLNMTDAQAHGKIDIAFIDRLFQQAANLGADQITFRKLYSSKNSSPQSQWVEEHSIDLRFWNLLNPYIRDIGIPLERLPYGARRYSVKEMSVVIDDDSMSCESKDEIKYLILRPDCHLYTRWDTKGSLLF